MFRPKSKIQSSVNTKKRNALGKLIFRYLPLTLAVLGLVIAGVVFLALRKDMPKVEAWFETGGTWDYRIPVTVDNSLNSNTLTDFQVFVEIDSSNAEFWANVDVDGDDVRWVKDDHATLFDFFELRFATTSQEALYWVKVDSIAASDITTIYLYYGSTGQSNLSSAENTFSYATREERFVALGNVNDNAANALSMFDNNSMGYYTSEDTDFDTAELKTVGATAVGAIASSTKPIAISGSAANAELWSPIAWQTTEHYTVSYATNPTIGLYNPNSSDATVTVYDDGAAVRSDFTVTAGSYDQYDYTMGSDSHVRISSDLPLVSFIEGSSDTRITVMPTPALEWWGFDKTVRVVGTEDDTTASLYTSDDDAVSTNSSIASTTVWSAASGDGYAATAAYVTADKPIVVTNNADGNGNDSHVFYSKMDLDTEYYITDDTDFVSMSTPYADTLIRVYEIDDGVWSEVASSTATRAGSDPNPYEWKDGTARTGGLKITANNPFHVHHDQSSDDENNVANRVINRKGTWPLPSVSLGSQESRILGWYNSSWGYRKQIVIDHTKVSGTPTLSSFPFMFSITDSDLKFTSYGGKVASSTGADILFTSNDGTTKLFHEIEKYSSTTGETIAWVKIPRLFTTADTTVYIYYGNASTTDQQDATNVWDSNYKGVWHLGDGTILDTNDSTSNSNNATNTGVTSVSGKIDGAAYFGQDNYAEIIDQDYFSPFANDMTISFWANVPTDATAQGGDTCGSSGAYFFGKIGEWAFENAGNTVVCFNLFNWTGSTHSHLSVDMTVNDAQWHYYTMKVSYLNSFDMYIDGSLANSTTSFASTMSNKDTDLFFNSPQHGDTNPYGYDYVGSLDQAEISSTLRSADWIATEYNNQSSPSTFYSYGAEGGETRSGAGVRIVNRGWYDTAWGYRKAITVDHTKVATSTQYNFPMLFSITDSDLKDTTNGGKVGKSDGTDIFFTSDDGTTKLSHEIEKYSSSTGEIIIWVKISSLSPTQDTKIYMYYGNSNAADQQDAENVWNSNYKGVWHLGEGYSTAADFYKDSTSNTNDGTLTDDDTDVVSETGKVGLALTFPEGYTNENDSINLGSDTSIDELCSSSDFTAEAWIKPTTDTAYGKVFNKDDYDGWSWYYEYTINSLRFTKGFSSTNGLWSMPTNQLVMGNWYHVVVVYNGSATTTDPIFYVNGSVVATTENTTPVGSTDLDAAKTFYIANNGGTYNWRGTLDEMRVSKAIARSADWIATEYNNQFSPSTFYSVSGEESISKWYNSSWTGRKEITIDHNKISQTATTTLYGFPMLFSVTDSDLKYTGSGGKVGKTNGGDILFTLSDGTTKLSHEIESYSSSTGETVAWVNIPTLSATQDTTLYIYYGNAGVEADQWDTPDGSNDVFDTNYKGVWHLGEDPAIAGVGGILDSTSNGNDGTDTGSMTADDQVDGQIDGSLDFDGGDDYINLGSKSLGYTKLSVFAWAKGIGGSGTYNGIVSKWGFQDFILAVALASPNKVVAYAINTAGQNSGNVFSNEGMNDNLWHLIGFIADETNLKVYFDGVYQNQGNLSGNVRDTSAPITIGSYSTPANYFGGSIDEVRIYNGDYSVDWIKTEYNNQFSPSTFYSYGASQAESRQDSSGNPAPAVKSRGGVKFR